MLGVVQLVSDKYFSLCIFFYTLSAILPAYRGEGLKHTYTKPDELRAAAWRFSTQYTYLHTFFSFMSGVFFICFLVDGRYHTVYERGCVCTDP
jgi:hypothetical protein